MKLSTTPRVVKLYGDPVGRGHYLRDDRDRTMCGDSQPWEDRTEPWGGSEPLVICSACLREHSLRGN